MRFRVWKSHYFSINSIFLPLYSYYTNFDSIKKKKQKAPTQLNTYFWLKIQMPTLDIVPWNEKKQLTSSHQHNKSTVITIIIAITIIKKFIRKMVDKNRNETRFEKKMIRKKQRCISAHANVIILLCIITFILFFISKLNLLWENWM